VPSMWDVDPARVVHEPVFVLLPELPATPP
jgi:hypothetical protein